MIQQHRYWIAPAGNSVQILKKPFANYSGIQFLTNPSSGWLQRPSLDTNLYVNLGTGVSI